VNEIATGDCREILPRWAAAGIRAQTCITSPPYWGLRDYGTAQWQGGNDECDHVESEGRTDIERMYAPPSVATFNKRQYREVCAVCGATRIDQQIGLEPTVDGYVAAMVEVFRLVREVLADDGTLWLNLGDSYSFGSSNPSPKHVSPNVGVDGREPSLLPKNLCGIPWRVALALQADGWYLRSDIIWAKPNPMPESVTDRPTKSHEYLFLMAKSERYYYDADSIKEYSINYGQEKRFSVNKVRAYAMGCEPSGNEVPGVTYIIKELRNRRDVWTVATEPYAEAHFATFPTKLIEPCVLAGSRTGDIVLDPFIGSGTVARVAQRLARQYLGCDLNPQYVQLCDERTRDTIGMPL
jgi:DNA modification methylase